MLRVCLKRGGFYRSGGCGWHESWTLDVLCQHMKDYLRIHWIYCEDIMDIYHESENLLVRSLWIRWMSALSCHDRCDMKLCTCLAIIKGVRTVCASEIRGFVRHQSLACDRMTSSFGTMSIHFLDLSLRSPFKAQLSKLPLVQPPN